jgi:hypothetical protein
MNASFKATLANVPFLWERIVLSRNGLSLELVSRPEIAAIPDGELEGKQFSSLDVAVSDVPASRFAEVHQATLELSELLGFVTGSMVRFPEWHYPDGNPSAQWRNVVGVYRSGFPVIPFEEPGALKAFLELTWPTYSNLRQPRTLDVALEYVLCGRALLPLEGKLVIDFVMLEHLKHTYAVTNGYLADRFGLRPQTGGPRARFERVLREMFAAVGMVPTLAPLIDLRNALIHTGLPHDESLDLHTLHGLCQDLVREYLLRVLGFVGEYLSFSDPNGRKRIDA